MNRLVMIFALTSTMALAQSPYSRDSYSHAGHGNQGKTGITLSAGFEFGSANVELDNSQLNSALGGIQTNGGSNQDYDLTMRGFNIQGSYDSGLRFGEAMSTSTNFGVSHLSSSSNDDDNNNQSFSNIQNFAQPGLEAKKTTVYIEQTLNFNAEFEGLVFQPFIALNLGVGKFSFDDDESNSFNNSTFNNSQFGQLQNLETNFFQAGLAIGANFIIADSFVPFIKGRFTKEFHSVSSKNDGQNNQFSGGFNQNNNQDPDLDTTTISGIVGIGYAF